MKFYSYSKYLISSFIIAACCLQQCCLGQSTTVRPYKFGFTIEEQQHRREMRDERGIVMGEFGFITADGIYHVTVYATDEQGRFRILAMKNYPYESPPKTVEVMVQPKAAPTTTTPKPLKKHNFNTEACSGCFLANGNNKPKGSSDIEGKAPKNDIRPLSKDLTNPSESSATNPKLPSKTPSSSESVIFKNFNALKNVVTSQHLHTTPSTLAPKNFILAAHTNAPNMHDINTLAKASNVVASKTLALQPNKAVTIPYTNAHNKKSTLPYKEVTTSSLHAANNADITHLTNNSNQVTGVPYKNSSHTELTRHSTITSSQNAVKSLPVAANKVGTTAYTDSTNRAVTSLPDIRSQVSTKADTIAINKDITRPSAIASSQNSVKLSTSVTNKVSTTAYTNLTNRAVIPLSDAHNKVSAIPFSSASNKDVTRPLAISSYSSKQIDTTHSVFETNKVETTTYPTSANIFVKTPLKTDPNQIDALAHTNVSNNDYTRSSTSFSSQSSKASALPESKRVFIMTARTLPSTSDKTYVKDTFKIPLKTPAQQSYNNAQLNIAPHNQHQFALALSNTNNRETNLQAEQSVINNNLAPVKTKPYKFLKYDLSLPTNLAAQENTVSKTPLKNSFEQNLNTDSTGQSNMELSKQSVNTKLTALSSNPATLNTQLEAQSTQTAPRTKILQKQYTTSPVVSKDSNPKTSKPTTQGGSAASPASKTTTGIPPPIMDIIMQEVLPALMDKKGQSTATNPAQSTTLNSKTNAVASNQKPSSSNAGGVDVTRKSTGSSGSSSANDDGDLYRFKYILDYNGHTETGKRNGNKEGSYFVIGEDNVEHSIEYVANELGYQPRIRWRKLDSNEIKPKENTLKDYEFVWFQK